MRRLGNRIEEAAMSGVLAFAYGMHGEFDEAFEAAAHGIKLGRQIEHLPTQAACVFFSGVVRGWHGDLEVAVPQFDEALALCDKCGRRVPQVPGPRLARPGLSDGWAARGRRGRPQATASSSATRSARPSIAAPFRRFVPSSIC